MEVVSFDTLKLLGWKEQIQNDPHDDGYNDISKERGPKIQLGAIDLGYDVVEINNMPNVTFGKSSSISLI